MYSLGRLTPWSVVLGLVAGVVILVFVLAIFPVSWMPPTQQALNNLNRTSLEMLTHLVQKARRAKPGVPISRADLKAVALKEGYQFERIMQEYPSGQPFEILARPRVLGEALLVGHDEDANGMVWAITDAGKIVKCFPKHRAHGPGKP